MSNAVPCDVYRVFTFHEAVESYLKTKKPSEWILTPNGQFQKADEMNYRDVHSLHTTGGIFLDKLDEGESDMMVFYYEGYCIEIQPYSEGGWDYTIYLPDGKEWDGGVYDDEDASVCLVLSEIILDIKKIQSRIACG